MFVPSYESFAFLIVNAPSLCKNQSMNVSDVALLIVCPKPDIPKIA